MFSFILVHLKLDIRFSVFLLLRPSVRPTSVALTVPPRILKRGGLETSVLF